MPNPICRQSRTESRCTLNGCNDSPSSRTSFSPSAIGYAIEDLCEKINNRLFDTEELASEDESTLWYEDWYEYSDSEIEDLHSKPTCPECGEPIVFEGGCNICKSCGWSKCD